MSEQKKPRDAQFWAKGIETLRLSGVPAGAVNLNVDGRRAVGPLQGFGKMWKKTYEARLEGAKVSPGEVIEVWKARFPEFWERGNRFYAPLTGLKPGEVVLINNPSPGGGQVSTGVVVIYADEESFTFMTPEGHPFSGWVTFSAHEEAGVTVARVQVLIRSNDPLYELMMPLALHRIEDDTWRHTLRALARHFGAGGSVEMESICVDPRRQWANASNLRHNAAIRSAVHAATAPLRRIARLRAGHGKEGGSA